MLLYNTLGIAYVQVKLFPIQITKLTSSNNKMVKTYQSQTNLVTISIFELIIFGFDGPVFEKRLKWSDGLLPEKNYF